MRLLGSAAVLLLVLAVPAAVAQPSKSSEASPPYSESYQDSWAVVIGIDSYQKAPRLNYAAADAKAVFDLLPSLGFPRDNTQLLLDGGATKAKIESALYQGLKRMGRDDRLFVYFAGHGETLTTRAGIEGYILPVDLPRFGRHPG